MRLRLHPRPGLAGSVLAASLMTVAVVGMALASYLVVVNNQNRSVMRSTQWNAALPLAEAGVEEALAQLNNRGLSDFTGWTASTNGWQIQRSLGDGHYVVHVSTNFSASPVITSTGYAPSLGTMTGATNGTSLSRTVRVTTQRNSLFARGLVARDSISWTGNIYTDSFDSLDPNHSNAGRYDFAKRKGNGSVGANSGNILMGGGRIYGNASTGPTNTVSGGTIGDMAWHADPANNGKVQPGHYNNDMNIFFPEVQPPFNGGYLTPGPGTASTTNIITTTNTVSSWTVPVTTNQIHGVWTTNLSSYPVGAPYVETSSHVTVKGKKHTTNFVYAATNWYSVLVSHATNVTTQSYAYILDTGNYQLASLSLSGQNMMLVRGDAVLYVTGPFSMAGQSQIDIAVGAGLKLYAGGDVDLKGNGIMNANVDSLDFTLYGLPGCNSIDFGGNASFTGTIYAPNAVFKAGGGGNDQYDVVGAVIARTITMNGHFVFHYDEALGRTGPGSGFVLTSWNEL